MTEKKRHWMRIELKPHKIKTDFNCTPIFLKDSEALGHLMNRAYRGTIDSEGETLDQCMTEMRETLTGKYGSFLARASFQIEEGWSMAAASIITLYKDKPLLAFCMTDPNHQKTGMARILIQKAMEVLHSLKHTHLYLVVTEGNKPAEHLFKKLGFELAAPL